MHKNRKLFGVLALIFCFPFLYLFILSFAVNYKFPELFPARWSLRYWIQFSSMDSGLLDGFLLSTLIALSVASISTSIAFFISKIISSEKKNTLLYAYLPFVMTPVVLAACLQYFFISAGLSGTIPGVILGQLFITFPYGIILFSSHWNVQMKELEGVAITLGSNQFNLYKRVLIPASKDILVIVFFQTFLISWFEYGLTSVLGVGKVSTLTVMVFQFIYEANIAFAALCSCALIFPPLILLWFNRKFVFNQWSAR